ncbi:Hypothetical protein PHPALM_4889, partial [Phytophthora palmivora]
TSAGSGKKQRVIQKKKVVDEPWDPDDGDVQEESDSEEGENQNETPASKKRAVVKKTKADAQQRQDEANKSQRAGKAAKVAARKRLDAVKQKVSDTEDKKRQAASTEVSEQLKKRRITLHVMADENDMEEYVQHDSDTTCSMS